MTTFGTAFTITSSTNGTIATCPAAEYSRRFLIINNGTSTCLLGGASSGTQGYPLTNGASIEVTLESGESLYGFCPVAGTADVRVLGFTGGR